MPDQPTIVLPLDLPDVRVLHTEITIDHELLIEVESTLTTTICRRCGQTISAFYGYDRPIRLRHLPSFGYVVYIQLRPKRFRCPFCDDHPTTTQRLNWYDPKALHTTAYERYLLLLLVNSTIADVCQKEDVAPDALQAIVDRWIDTVIDWRTVPTFATMGIDEIACKKGHRDFVALVTARLPTGTLYLLAVLPDRTKETMRTWLKTIPAATRSHIRTVCTDMWEAYVASVREILPHATIVIDRFHVAHQYRAGADTLRKQEVKRLRQELSKDDAKVLEKTLWPFRKRASALDTDEQERLDALFGYSPQLKAGYEFREHLTTIFDTARSKAAALRQIKAWRRKVEASGLTCFNPFLKLLDTWLDLIANYFRHRQNSGFVEGLNNKLKVLKRRCFGIYNLGHLFQRITLDLQGYRQFSPW
jgi:transposase